MRKLEQRKSDWIEKSISNHGSKYDYSKVEYINANTNVVIICTIHGEFSQRPADHSIRKSGCKKCSDREGSLKRVTKNTESFILEAVELHGDTYDYSKVHYVNSKTSVVITCRNHGDFTQLPHVHLRPNGCNKCGDERSGRQCAMTTEEFISRSKKVHGDKFDYSKVDYKRQNHKVLIGCPTHGFFEQNPGNNLAGCGCEKCAIEEHRGGYSEKFFENRPLMKSYPSLIYLLKVTDNRTGKKFNKIGITRTTVEERYRGYNNYTIEITRSNNMPLYKAYLLEQRFLKIYNKHQYFAPADFAGRTECFKIKET